MKSYLQIRRALAGKLWFMHEQKMNEMLAFLEIKLSGGSSAAETIAAIRAANEISAARAQSASASGAGTVAVIPIYGIIMHRGSVMDISGGSSGTSTETISQQLRQAVADPNVSAIVLDVDSPGGDVDNVDELATEIYNARKQKKITAVSNSLCASAAYYLACQATEMVVSPSSLTGSIGVYTMHADYSEGDAAAGVKITLIKFGENKAEGNDFSPLSASAQEHLQEMVDTFGAMFEKAVGRGRKVSQDEVHKKFGQGRVFDAKTAVRLGMADRVGTLDDVLQGYGVSRGGGASAALDVPVRTAETEPVDLEPVNADGKPQCPVILTGARCSSVAGHNGGHFFQTDEMRKDTGGAGVWHAVEPGGDCNLVCVFCRAGECVRCVNEACTCDGVAKASARRMAAERRRRLGLAGA